MERELSKGWGGGEPKEENEERVTTVGKYQPAGREQAVLVLQFVYWSEIVLN